MRNALALIFGWLAFASVHAADLWYVQGDQAMLTVPRHGAEVAATLPSQTRVEWRERQGGFVKVRSGNMEGWVLIFGLRSGISKGGNVLGEISSTVSAPLRKTDPTRIVASVGVRGVMEEALSSNNTRLDEIMKLEMLSRRSRDLPAEKLWRNVETFKVEHLPEQSSTPQGSTYE